MYFSLHVSILTVLSKLRLTFRMIFVEIASKSGERRLNVSSNRHLKICSLQYFLIAHSGSNILSTSFCTISLCAILDHGAGCRLSHWEIVFRTVRYLCNVWDVGRAAGLCNHGSAHADRSPIDWNIHPSTSNILMPLKYRSAPPLISAVLHQQMKSYRQG